MLINVFLRQVKNVIWLFLCFPRYPGSSLDALRLVLSNDRCSDAVFAVFWYVCLLDSPGLAPSTALRTHSQIASQIQRNDAFFILCISSVRWMASGLSLPCFCFSIPNAPCELLLCPCYCRLVDNKYTRSNHSKIAVCQWCGTSRDPPHRFQLQLRTIFCLLGLSWGIFPGSVQVSTL